MNKLPAGWGWPGAARKAHFFEDGSITSVCGRWLHSGHREPANGKGSPDDCAPCTRWLRKHTAVEVPPGPAASGEGQ